MQILVYRYMYWDEDARVLKKSSFYATLELIRDGLDAPICTDPMAVDSREVDGGIYNPAAGDWVRQIQ